MTAFVDSIYQGVPKHQSDKKQPIRSEAKHFSAMKKSIIKMTIGELGSLAQLVVETVDKTTLDAAQHDASFLFLKEVTNRFLDSVGRSAYSKQTEALNALADERVKCLKGLRNLVNNLVKSPDKSVAAIVTPIKNAFAQYGTNIDMMKPLEQTVYMQTLIMEIKNVSTDTQRSNAGVKAWFDALEQSLIDYNKLYVVRGNEQVEIKNTLSATKLSGELRSALTDFSKFVTGRRISEKTEEWIALEQQIAHRFVASVRSIITPKRRKSTTTTSTLASVAEPKA